MRVPRFFRVLTFLLAGAGCSNGGESQKGGELQKAVQAHCLELERHVDLMARSYREGRNSFPLLGGELSGELLTVLYREVSWCAGVRVDEGRKLLALTQELSVVIDDVNGKFSLAVQGRSAAEGWDNPEASAARADVAAKLDRVAAIVREINQRPLKR